MGRADLQMYQASAPARGSANGASTCWTNSETRSRLTTRLKSRRRLLFTALHLDFTDSHMVSIDGCKTSHEISAFIDVDEELHEIGLQFVLHDCFASAGVEVDADESAMLALAYAILLPDGLTLEWFDDETLPPCDEEELSLSNALNGTGVDNINYNAKRPGAFAPGRLQTSQ